VSLQIAKIQAGLLDFINVGDIGAPIFSEALGTCRENGLVNFAVGS